TENQIPCLIVAGETCSPELAAQWAQGRHFFNAYGPTETTVCATAFEYTSHRSDSVPIGRPIANTEIYILDTEGQPVPAGISGELHVGGAGLARGYLNRPELTQAKFMANPFSDDPDTRLYKTGDLVRFCPDGNIDFISRRDNQIKLRGFRIELGEIESILSQCPGVRECAVIMTDKTSNPQLAAYWTDLTPRPALQEGERGKNRSGGAALLPLSSQERGPGGEVAQLRAMLQQRLPDYMIPSVWTRLDEMPLLPNGKIDRQALARRSVVPQSLAAEQYVAPREPIEIQLVHIWEVLLDVRSVGVRDNFFEIGGQSLLAVRLMVEIETRFGKALPVATLFQAPTIEQLAVILHRQTTERAWATLVPIRPKRERPPFFCVPGVGGHVVGFYDLARHLGERQPFYALQARGLDGESAPHTRMETMASAYIQEIQALQPHGPYFLSGHSFGGHVAFEMARQLIEHGQQIDMLAVFDVVAPRAHVVNRKEWDNLRWLQEIIATFERALEIPLSIRIDALQALPPEEQLHRLYDALQRKGLIPPAADIRWLRGILNVFKANWQMLYVPAGIAPLQLSLFRAAEPPVDVVPEDVDLIRIPDMGWQAFARHVDVREVAGNHYTMLREPHVQTLANQLTQCIDKELP
ncbi:MAG: AMP-binding protein, partial [bacterium]|nr:AMP-binding protein [bacterium]